MRGLIWSKATPWNDIAPDQFSATDRNNVAIQQVFCRLHMTAEKGGELSRFLRSVSTGRSYPQRKVQVL
jgi:hypothetical protein